VARGITNSDDRRVLQLPLGRDRVKVDADVLRDANGTKAFLFVRQLAKDGRHGKNPGAGFTERSQQGVVLKLAQDPGPDGLRFERYLDLSPGKSHPPRKCAVACPRSSSFRFVTFDANLKTAHIIKCKWE